MYNLYIRPLKEDDAKTSFNWRNDSDIWHFTQSRPDHEITYEIEREWIKNVLKDNTCRRFAIIVNNVYVGNIQLTNIIKGTAEYHIFIGDKNYLGKGLSNYATYYILNFAKEELNLNEVYLSVHKNNTAAVKSYRRSGFHTTSEKSDWIRMSCILQNLYSPRVSIFVMVYNHEKFLRDCLDGILMQKCTFPYNIVVGEDCSKDLSREILMDYKKRYPGKFKLLLHSNNIGARKNQNIVLENCNGNYIATCEGDDYWTDPLKLQKQIKFLESNTEYVLTHHDASVIDEKGNQLRNSKLSNFKKKDFSARELQEGVSLATLTLCFRNIFFNRSIEFPDVVNGDFALISLLGLHGKGKYMENILPACYRVHSGGIWSETSQVKKNIAKYGTFEEMSKYYFRMGNKVLGSYYKKKLKQQFKIIVIHSLRNKNFKEALGYLKRYNRYYFKHLFY